MVTHAAMEYVITRLSKNFTATVKRSFLRNLCRYVISMTVNEELVSPSVEWRQLVSDLGSKRTATVQSL
jgi:hypothetical protein